MPVREHKVRVVSVRFTQDEYDALTKACEAEQSRSLSEFTRAAMKERLALTQAVGNRAQNNVDLMVQRLEKLYEQFRATTQRMAEIMGGTETDFLVSNSDNKANNDNNKSRGME